MKKTTLYLSIIFITLFVNSIAQEKFTLFHENGTLKVKGELIDGKKHGIWEAYDADKKLILKREYDNNKLIKNYLDNTETKETKLQQEDVIWSKRVERILISNSQKNTPLYHNKSLKLALLKTIDNNEIGTYTSLSFDKKIDKEAGLKRINTMDFSKSTISLKEDWYFNKKTNMMDVMIIGLSIVEENNKEAICFYFPTLKKHLGKSEVTIDDRKLTLETYFDFRMFESEITKESNITEKGMTPERAKEIEKLLLDTEIEYWFKNN